MSNLKNSIVLVGNLGADPEIKSLDNGKKMVKISIATHDSHKNREGARIENTEWHRCVAWGKQAEVINQFFKKGNEIMVRGKMTYRNYQDRNGNTQYTSEVVIQEFSFMGKKAARA